MSGDLWQMARNGTTLLPGEAKKLATAYDRLRDERDKLLSELSISRLSYQQQDERLAFVEAERDAAEANAERRWEDILIAAKKIDRLQAILAALREPNEEVVEAAAEALYLRCDLCRRGTWADEMARYKESYYEDAAPIVRAAVAAAEQEHLTETTND